MSSKRRALHFVLKIGNLKKNVDFFRDKLGMTVLRHEVFDQGCEAACNGPYSTKWSKTMIGYGPEDNHFVLELTYNYSIGKYARGNDLQYIKISLGQTEYEKLYSSRESTLSEENDSFSLDSPDGYRFILSKLDKPIFKPDVTEVCLSSSNLKKSMKYWVDLLAMNKEPNQLCIDESKEVNLKYADDQVRLKLKQIDEAVDHKSAYGRIAFSCISHELKTIQKTIEDAGEKVLTPFLSLDTPGKATVQVVILADPDGNEICFVGDEGFRSLSQVDPDANNLLESSIAADKSDEWFQKKKIAKTEA